MLVLVVMIIAIASAGVLPHLPSLSYLFLGIAGWMSSLAILIKVSSNKTVLYIGFLLGVFVIAFAWSAFWGQTQLQDRLSPELEQQRLVLVGRVVGLPEPFMFDSNRYGSRLLIEVHEGCQNIGSDCSLHPVVLPGRIRVNWYGDEGPVSGELWQLSVKLKRPHGYQNPGGFDYERWLLARGIGATGYVRQSELNRRLESSPWWSVSYWRFQLRQRILKLNESSQSTDAKALLLALLLGDKSHIGDVQRKNIQALGLAHLLAISGLHIGMAATIGALFGGFIGRCLNACFPTRSYTHSVVVLCSWGLALVYAALAGFTLPTQRALIMLSVYFWMVIRGVNYSPWLGWWLAMALVMWVQPLSFYEVGFWLSFGAVAVLIACFRGDMGSTPSYLMGFVRAQWVLLLGVGLLQWFSGLSVSLLAPVANFVAIPFVGFVVTPLLFLVAGLSVISEPLFHEVALFSLSLLSWFDGGIDWVFAALNPYQPYWLWQRGAAISIAVAASALCGLCLWLLPMPLGFKVLSFTAVLLGFGHQNKDPDTSLEVRILDVGQGLAVTIHSGESHWLLDTGRDFHYGFVLEPYFRHMGIEQLEGLVVSHGDSDHAGSVAQLIMNMDVDTLYLGDEIKQGQADVAISLPQNVKIKPCDRDQSWQVGQFQLETLAWQDLNHKELSASSNNNSCVLLMTYAGVRVLFPGDIEKEREVDLLSHSALDIGVDIVVVPHHGSKTSSTKAFIERLSPAWALFSAGYRNQYGHPADEVVNRYWQQGSHIVGTAEAGAISLLIEPDGRYQIQGYRDQNRRYWR
jgi:competence protein ComEC